MNNNMSEKLEQVHSALQHFASTERDSYTATRQGGLTNLVYKITPSAGSGNLIVRIPGIGTEEYIDRRVEAHNAQVAANAGVSAEILYSDSDTGLMISRCIPDIVTMTPDLFDSRSGSPNRAGIALRKLHQSGEKFEFRFELFSMIDEYLDLLAGKNTDMPDGYHDIVKQAEPVKTVIASNPIPLSPCHCDPLCENFLDDGTIMWIVDWEYSGMNDPYWDLGDLSVEAGFSEAQDLEMMRAYCQGEPQAHQMGRMIVYKAMCDLLWTLWGLIQHADNNPAEDFWAYASNRFERCKSLMNSDVFDGAMAAIDRNQG